MYTHACIRTHTRVCTHTKHTHTQNTHTKHTYTHTRYSIYIMYSYSEDSKVARARVHVQAEDVQDSNYTIIMQMYCTDLEKKDFFGKVTLVAFLILTDILYLSK